jgi:hypothetical protein
LEQLREEINAVVHETVPDLLLDMRLRLIDDLCAAVSDYMGHGGANLLKKLGKPLRSEPNLDPTQRELIRIDVAALVWMKLLRGCETTSQD